MAVLYASGEITDDPTLKYLPSGTPVLEFRLADSYVKDGETRTTWIGITLWEELADLWAGKLAKGMVVKVSGPPRAEAWLGRDDGKPKAGLKVNARKCEIVKLSPEQTEEGDSREPQQPARTATPAPRPAAAPQYPTDDEDPFGDQ
jgi:single-strand DNA-binding protein